MNAVLQNLLKLQALEFGDEKGTGIESQVTELRALIPAPILGHYDRLRVRGKKGLAAARNQVCMGCHMRQPIGKITVLMRDEDIQLCDSCGRYLFLEEPVKEGETAAASAPAQEPAKAPLADPAQVPAVEAGKPAAKPRKRRERKTLATA